MSPVCSVRNVPGLYLEATQGLRPGLHSFAASRLRSVHSSEAAVGAFFHGFMADARGFFHCFAALRQDGPFGAFLRRVRFSQLSLETLARLRAGRYSAFPLP